MPVPANNFWSPFAPVHFPGSSGYVTGDQNPSIYGISWDPVNRRVVSNDPRIPGYDVSGRMKGSFQLPTAPNANGVNPYSALPGGYNPVGLPGVGGNNPANVNGTRAALGYNPTAAPGQGYNPFFTVANEKDPIVAAQLAQILGQYNALQGLNPTQVVTDAMKAADPAYKQYLGQETGAVSQWFPSTPGGTSPVQAQLDALAAKRAAAYQTATGRAMDAASAQRALQQMKMGGAGTVGDSSYLQKLGLDTNANLMAQEGLDAAQQARADFMTVMGGQQANLGTRAGLTTNDIQRQLLPSQVGANWFNQMLAGLSPIMQMQLMNNFYGLGQAGQSAGVSFPGVGSTVGGGGGGMAVRNSMPIQPYQPQFNPYQGMRRPTAPAQPFNNWAFDEFGNPINSQPITRAPVDYGQYDPNMNPDGTSSSYYDPFAGMVMT